MLTVKQSAHYGYKSVHDLPTPPSTSRPSPPLIYQESSHQKPLPAIPRRSSPSSQPMSGPHRGLPLPAAMTMAQQTPQGPPGSQGPPPPPPPPPVMPLGQPAPPYPHQHQQGQMVAHHGPAPMPHAPPWQGPAGDEGMRVWLLTKAEDDKRRAEEEKTRQETLRLEQRRIEQDILRTSLQGGIPPPMIPVVFAGMGGGNLPQAALEWAYQYVSSPAHPPPHPPQLLPPGGQQSPEHRRDSQTQAYGPYPGSGGVPSTPGSAQGAAQGGGFVPPFAGSPTRPRGYSVPGPGGRGAPVGSNLPNINTNVQQGPGGPGTAHPAGMALAPQLQDAQQPSQASPSIYFHHWQPPTHQQASGSSSNQPSTPSAGDTPRKRKATGPPMQQAPPPSTQPRLQSPPFASSSTLSNPPPGRRRGHGRQRSDVAPWRPSMRGGRMDTFRALDREVSPVGYGSAPGSTSREGDDGPGRLQQQPARGGLHSVSSLLAEEPSAGQTGQYGMHQQGANEGRESPLTGEAAAAATATATASATRGGAAGSAATREGDND